VTEPDLQFVTRALAAGLVLDPVLELGAGYDGPTCKPVVVAAGLRHTGSDLKPGPNVDVAADLESADDLRRFDGVGPFGTVLLLNVLEHTFDPIRVLDNVVSLVRPGGTVVAVTPAVWPLHDYPYDAWRPLPNFYEEYARRRGLTLHPDFFEYVGFGKVAEARNPDGSYRFPRPGRSARQWWYSRAVHRVFNTAGRGMFQPSHVAVGCVFRKS
jgi:SAM-dependent methyltransferase